MKSKLLLFFVIIATTFACKELPPPSVEPIAIIPQPNSVKQGDGFFEITKKTLVSVEDEAQQKTAILFFKHFETVAGWMPKVEIKGKGSIRFQAKENLEKEAYELISTPETLSILASSQEGFFYGLQSLRQLLPKNFVSGKLQTDQRWAIPVVEIKDEPRFGWRGFMMDASRHFYDKEAVKIILDQIAALKMNTFHWHLTDDQGWRIEIKKYPKLTEVGAWRVNYNDHDENNNRWWGRPNQKPGDKADYGGFYTQEDVKEIIAYAAERNITVIPEIDVPGHSQAIIASYPEVACHPGPYYVATGGVFKDNTLCPGKEVTFEFMENVLDEVINLFPSKYIHIGGDECNKEAWKKDKDCQARMKKEGLKNENELQSYFIKRMEKIINDRGRIMIGWDEILEGGLAPNAVVMTWRGEEGGIKAAKDGHSIIMTPSKFCYLDLKQGHTDHEPNFGYSQCLLSNCYNYNPVPESLKDNVDLIKGIQANIWMESLPDFDKLTYMLYPRLYAVAENGWSKQEDENWDDFIQRLYPQFDRLDQEGIRYAKSAFNVWIDHTGNEKSITINLHTEANGLDLKYTLDGSEPTMESNSYTEPFDLNKSTVVKATSFRNGKQEGKVTQKAFYINKAANAEVIYHTLYLGYKKALGDKVLVDHNFGINWSIDKNWQKFKTPEVEFDLVFEKEIDASSVRMNFMQMAILGVYMPEEVSILGSKDGKNYKPLATESLREPSMVQGRYIQRPKIDFPKGKFKSLKVKLKAVNPIYPGHHKDGALSKIYLDEVVVE